MGNRPCVPLRRSNRDAARLAGDETLAVTLELDTDKREVTAPADLVTALAARPPAMDRWRALSYSHQREHVEAIDGAKQPATRGRRIAAAVAMVVAKPAARAPKPRLAKPPRVVIVTLWFRWMQCMIWQDTGRGMFHVSLDGVLMPTSDGIEFRH